MTEEQEPMASQQLPSVAIERVELSSNVAPSTATGTVTFSIDGTAQPAVTLFGGQASLSTSTLAVGTHQVITTYSGDANDGSSISDTLTQTVQGAVQSSIQSGFNSQTISAGNYVWFNSVFKLKSPAPSSNLTIYFTGQTINLQLANGTTLKLNAPNAKITFSPSVTKATTTFDTTDNQWVTTVPASFTDNVFLSGLAYKVPSGLSLASAKVMWSGYFSGSSTFSVNWQFAAAVYTNFNTNYNSLGVKPLHSTALDSYPNSDQAGTPESYKQYITAGAMGGGGSNYTGSYSGTAAVSYSP